MDATVMERPALVDQGGEVLADRNVLQFLRFFVGTDTYAVRIELVREILEVTQMTPLPLMPAFVRGVMNLRGAVVPVVDLAARLGFAETEVGRRTCVVMVDLAVPDTETDTGVRQSLGVLVDAVQEVFDVDEESLESVPRMGTKIDPMFIQNIVRVRGQVTPALDLQYTLAQKALSELIAQYTAKGASHAVATAV